MSYLDNEDDEFILEHIDRYKLTVKVKDKDLITTSNVLESLIHTYDELVRDNLTSDEHLIVSIFDYDLNTNIYYYDSVEEKY